MNGADVLLDLLRCVAEKPSVSTLCLMLVPVVALLIALLGPFFRLIIALGAQLSYLASSLLISSCSPLSVLLLLLLSTLYIFHELYWKRRRMPPGPVPWLIAGNMPQVLLHGARNIDALLQRWHARYGGIFTFWMGPIPMVMVSDVELLRRYFVRHGDEFSGRWQNFITHTFMDGHNGVVQVQGPKWREQRRFALHLLRDFGLGRALMEHKIGGEVRALVAHLRELPESARDAPVDVCKPVGVCIANIIDSILFGRTYAHDDPDFIKVQQMLDRQSALVVRPVMGLYLSLPFTTRLPGLRSSWRELLSIRDQFWAFLDSHIRDHKRRFSPDDAAPPTDFTFAYLQEMHRRRAAGETMGHFSEKQLKMLLLDLFFAGSETTVTTTKWGILMLILHPHVQQRCHAELLAQLGDREAELGDRAALVYLSATIAEIQRMANILPINLLRTCEKCVELDGFRFPAGTMVIPQISITLGDPAHFPDPDQFRPERFIDPERGTLRRVDAFLPFSIGKRQCLGESLARAELFLIFAELIRHFEFLPESDTRPPLRQRIYGLTVSPQPFKCRIVCRQRNGRGAERLRTTDE